MSIDLPRFIFDFEVFAYDWIVVFKNKRTKEYFVFHNDNDGVRAFMDEHPLLGGFNNKHYDQFILKAVLADADPQKVKAVNDFIIVQERNGWEHPLMKNLGREVWFDQYDLMDDCQMGLSLKAIEAHLGMDIQETTVDFNLDRPLTDEELEKVIHYCKHDVDATDALDDLRQNYLENKIVLGAECSLEPARALYMTNAKLTAQYLGARATPHDDEREYRYPGKLRREYIPPAVFSFFDRLHDKSISDETIFSEKLEITVGDCPVTLGYGGIHGAIPCYLEEAREGRTIRNKDVASYYPHQMTLNGYCSRNIPSPAVYASTIERRVRAKKAGDKATANALKLVLNTTYGAMLNEYNELYDPLMGRSVCISGQLQLLELAEHLVGVCPTLRLIQLNTDGIMVSLDNTDVPVYEEITEEWQNRTGFELEEDFIRKIVQKDVNNYVELPLEGEPKIKGGVLVRGIVTNGNVDFPAMGFPAWTNTTGGAFNINNNAVVIANAVREYFANGTPIRETVEADNTLLDYQLVAKASSKYGPAYHMIGEEPVQVQKVNRVYAAKDYRLGTLYKRHLGSGNLVKQAGLPAHCLVDNDNHETLAAIDREWYIREAERYVRDFLGIKPPKRNTRKVNSIKRNLLKSIFE